MQTIKVILVKLTQISAASAFSVLGLLLAFNLLVPTMYDDCEGHTRLLNGGTKIYDGERLNVVLCGTGADKNGMNDWVRLQILSERGGLLAQRSFRVDWDTNFPRELEYNRDYLTYFDASQDHDFEHKINMPPTWWDHVKTRLPLLS